MLNHIVSGIRWLAQSAECEELLAGAAEAGITPLNGGLEAAVYRIKLPEAELVLKIWDHEPRPDVSLQYTMLEQMYRQGIAVPCPYGWGMDADQNPVLLTSFDGTPAMEVSTNALTAIAGILLDIHTLQIDSGSGIKVPRYDFADYFFPAIAGHPEIRELLLELADRAGMTQGSLIHGDYHPGNILESGGAYTVIDWTNIQLGDPRYDISWSVILIWIYVGECYAEIYRSIFVASGKYTALELELFEAMACLRWLQLHRTTGIPLGPDTPAIVRSILRRNPHLPDSLL